MKRIFVFLIPLFLLLSCDSTRVYEDFTELPSGWAVSDTVSFEVELESSEVPYELTSQFRCDISYPYSNLYYYFLLKDENDSLLLKELQEVALFDLKTGKPLGSGLGDLYHIEDLSFGDFGLDENSKFTVSLVQYMRLDTLKGIDRIGLRVNTQSSN